MKKRALSKNPAICHRGERRVSRPLQSSAFSACSAVTALPLTLALKFKGMAISLEKATVPKKRTETFTKDCDAISEIIGELMMITIAVVAFGLLVVIVFSYKGPADSPQADIDGWVNVGTDTVYFRHGGGELIDVEDLRIMLNLNGTSVELSPAGLALIYGKPEWGLGDAIEINTSVEWGITIGEDDYVGATIVHTGAGVVIQTGTLLGEEVVPTATATATATVTPTPTPTPTPPPTGGIVSLWKFDEDAGEIAYDSIDGNDGAISGATWTTGINNSALYFDGDAYVSVPDDPSLNPGEKLTVEAWVKWGIDPSTGDKWANIVNKGADNQYQIQHDQKNTKFEFAVRTDTGRRFVQSTTRPEMDVWYYVVGTYNSTAGELMIYVNGVEEDSGGSSSTINPTTSNVYIGKRSYSDRYFNGTIDNVAIWDRDMTSEEIRTRYNETMPEERGIVSQWHLDEDAGGVAYDSADGNNGTITGATWTTGVNGSALHFDGEDDYVRVPGSASLTGMDELTIEAWVNLDELGGVYRDVVGKDSQYKLRLSPSGEGYVLSGTLYLDGSYNSITTDGDDGIDTTGEWYYLVFTYNGSHADLYINGELKKTAEAEGSVQPDINYLTIGGKPSASHTVGGTVDEVAIYDTALSPTEIKARYDALKPVKPAGGIVSRWDLNEDAGSIAYDSADGNNGTITGATWTTGVNGSALEFDGQDDKVEIDNNDNLDLTTITVEAWIKPRNLNTFGRKTFVDKNNFIDSGWTFLHSYEFYNGIWDNYLITNINYDHVRSKQAVVENEWQYVAFTYNSTHLNIYYNGCEIYSGEKQYDLSSSEKLVIGSGNIGNYYNGTIDEVSVYDRALTADEILECYNATKPEESAAISEWAMDEGSGEIAYDSADSNNGKISGAAWTTGVTGSALSFDGENDYVLVPNSENLNPLDGITIEAWASTTEHITSKVVDKGDWKGYDIALDKHNGWKGGVYIDGEKYKVGWSGKRPVIDQWYYLVLTYDGSAVTLYVDGVKEDTMPASGSLKSNSDDLSIGSVGGEDKFFSGVIDEVSVYGKALTPEEVKERYESVK